ncbi:hypothetical protein FKM82_013885 [Ascaphus truei]
MGAGGAPRHTRQPDRGRTRPPDLAPHETTARPRQPPRGPWGDATKSERHKPNLAPPGSPRGAAGKLPLSNLIPHVHLRPGQPYRGQGWRRTHQSELAPHEPTTCPRQRPRGPGAGWGSTPEKANFYLALKRCPKVYSTAEARSK